MLGSIKIGGYFGAEAFHNQEHADEYANWVGAQAERQLVVTEDDVPPSLRPLWKSIAKNGVVTSASPNGIDGLMNREFRGLTQTSTWYIGLINNSGFSALAAADTLSSHAGWSELTNYTIAGGSALNRATWSPDASASGVLTNSSAAAFTATATVTAYGAFVCADQAKATTSGALWATGAFSGTQALISGQVLNVTYTLTGTGS